VPAARREPGGGPQRAARDPQPHGRRRRDPRSGASPDNNPLSARETEILQLLAKA